MHESTQCINALTCAACREWREEEESNKKKSQFAENVLITLLIGCVLRSMYGRVVCDARDAAVWMTFGSNIIYHRTFRIICGAMVAASSS